ncbi:MAG: DNA primase small subunit PriS [Thermoplasmata archaeon]|nr:DNA primase small subunit PriS [Thermoplasmata archaeon]
MGKTVALDPPTLEWAHRQFQTYYRSTHVEPPARFTRREFAAFPFSVQTLMRRHASFRSAEDLRGFLEEEAPRHVYYSSAYYRNPSDATMVAKEWLGADLIFDLDADHLRQAEGKTYAEQLTLARSRFRDLVDDFLLGDFGFDPRDVTLVFSGGRGFHAHVHADAVLTLSSGERRELVEYILGVGVDPREGVREMREGERGPGLSMGPRSELAGTEAGRPTGVRQRPFQRLAPPDAPGWPGRITRAFFRILTRWEDGGAELAAREMQEAGAHEAVAREWADRLVRQGKGRRIREGLTLDVAAGDFPPELLAQILEQARIDVQGETDAPVTTDIHRLIRLPGSLHGGTGFRVLPLAHEELDRFEPFRDAPVPFAGTSPVDVRLLTDVSYPTFPEATRGKEGETLNLPRATALFLTLRGEARPAAAGAAPTSSRP